MPLRLVIRLDERTARFPLRPGELLLGSAPECDLTVPYFMVSRRHALLRVGEGALEIEDLGSSNGTSVDGHRVEGRVRVVPGQALVFGGLEAALEEVAEEDLEAAVVLAATAIEEEHLPEGDTPATSSLGAVKRFTLDHLPELLKALAGGTGAAGMAQRVGASLLATVPCSGVEIVRQTRDGTEGVLFSGGSMDCGRPPVEMELMDGRWVIRVGFASPTQERGYSPMVQACARLVELARPPGREDVRPLASGPPPLPEPPTISPAVRQIYTDAARVALGSISVLIRGESGTGKEVLARYIHAASPRSGEVFITLNCAALPRDLLEAELFGVERGAATGVEARPGRFELADGGTLFLDEIGDMAPETQARILRVLQEGEVYRLGASKSRSADVRVISATNRDLNTLLAEGDFRSDLYHRIADWDVTLPPLRARRADIPNLAAHFLEREAARHGVRAAGISRGAMGALTAYPWPGNIRQLEREMARAVLFLEDGQLLERAHLQEPIRNFSGAPAAEGLQGLLESTERCAILEALEAAGGDVPAAAEALGLARSTLYRRIKALGIQAAGATAKGDAPSS